MMLRILTPIFLAALPSLVTGHGHITNIVINSVSYSGWDIDTYPYESDPPTVVAWGTPNTSNGFITPDQYNTSDIICHLNATNAKGHAAVQAGDSINLVWTSWPSSHHGPVLTYLANCGDSCETVDKTTLEFFKIDAVGLVDDTDVPGTWGDDELISNNNSWMVEIPPTLKAGYYVMRHELIALHSAGAEDGAQNYPQCFNLQVIGSGTAQPSGVLGTDLYSPTDAGILVNIYTSLSYEIPGPTLFTGAVSVAQTTSAITASGTPTTGSDASAQTTTSTGTSPSTSTSAVSTVTTSVSTSSTTSAPTTLIVTTSTTQKTTTAAPTTSSAGSSAGGTTQSVYGQCGGSNWTGATACNAQATCSSMNPYYYQCVPTAV